jgi:hypothetical protein
MIDRARTRILAAANPIAAPSRIRGPSLAPHVETTPAYAGALIDRLR